MKKFCNVLLAFMHGWCHNMIWWFVIELLNIFPQVCFKAFYTVFFQEFIQMDFFGDHALAFHNSFALFRLTYCQNFPEGPRRIFSPYQFSAALGEYLFKTLQLLIK